MKYQINNNKYIDININIIEKDGFPVIVKEKTSESVIETASFLFPSWQLANLIEKKSMPDNSIFGNFQIDIVKLFELRLKYLLKKWTLDDLLEFDVDENGNEKLTDECFEKITKNIYPNILNSFLTIFTSKLGELTNPEDHLYAELPISQDQ